MSFDLLCSFYLSHYLLEADDGEVFDVFQGEGGEQGDALMPALFSLALDRALREGRQILQDDELAFAFLDDVYLLVHRDRAKLVFDHFARLIEDLAGVRPHLGKTRCWGEGATDPPPGFEDMDAAVWRGDHDPAESGVIMLGSPIGTPEFVQKWCAKRSQRTEAFLDKVADLTDAQCRWLLLRLSAEPRANHVLRNLHPEASYDLAVRHDEALWQSLLALLNERSARDVEVSRRVANLPTRHGGAGLRSARRTASGAHWAAWADALPFICERFPLLGRSLLNQLNGRTHPVPAVRAVRACAAQLDASGFLRPSWDALAEGLRPEPQEDAEPGAWQHGWQFFACDALERREAETLQTTLSEPVQALLRSQRGKGAGDWLSAIPTCAALTLESLLFLLALRRRLFLPLPAGPRACASCAAPLDPFGHHVLACSRTGWLKRRSSIVELAWVQVCAEAGGAAHHRPMLRDLALPGVRDDDTRQLDIVAGALPIYGGRTIVGDATLRSPLTGSGIPRFNAARIDGATFAQARRDKQVTYPEFFEEDCRIAFRVLACEVGGRFSPECGDLVSRLVEHKASQQPAPLRGSFRVILHRRWWGLLSVAVQRAVACNLAGADWPGSGLKELPGLEELLTYVEAPLPSRLR